MALELVRTDEQPRGWTDAERDAWWAKLSDYERCGAVAEVVSVTGDIEDVLYAVHKPWKFIDDAYDAHWRALQEMQQR